MTYAYLTATSYQPSHRKPWMQPYADTSHWNLPFGSGAVWAQPSDGDSLGVASQTLMGCTFHVNSGFFSSPHYIGNSITKTVVGATSSSTTVTFADVVDITVGMQVTGTGISGTPTVASITNNRAIVLSSAQTLSNGVVLTLADRDVAWTTSGAGVSNWIISKNVRVPIGAVEDPSSDKWIVVYDRTNHTVNHAYRFGVTSDGSSSFNNPSGAACSATTTTMTSFSGVTLDYRGDGLAVPSGTIGATVAQYGVVRKWELSAGRIQHKLRCSVGANALRSPTYSATDNNSASGGTWLTNIQWPAFIQDYGGGLLDGSSPVYGVNGGGTATNISQILATAQIRFGATVGIPITVNLAELNLSVGGFMIARAIQEYGILVSDSAGGNDNTITINLDDAISGDATVGVLGVSNNTLLSQIGTDLPKLIPYMRVLRNQSPTTVNGGGKPIVQGPPPLDLTA